MARNRSEQELASLRRYFSWGTAASTHGTFTINTGTPHRTTPTSMRPVTKAMPSAWMWQCPNCDSIKLIATMTEARCLACHTAAPMLPLRYGAVWGHEWAAVAHMRKEQIKYDDLDAEYDELRDEYSDYD